MTVTYTALREKTTIKTGGLIEIHTAALPVGAQVEVIVMAVPATVDTLGWPDDFFTRFAGCLPEFPIRESEGIYEIREELP
jgi:hypothetical protein